MTKDTIINAMAAQAGITQAAAASAWAAAVEVIASELARGNRVRVAGLGTFEPSVWAGRTARHPQTGAVIRIPRQMRVRFAASAELRARLNYSGADSPCASA